MSSGQVARPTLAAAPFFLQVHTTNRIDKSVWTIRLEPEILTLLSPKNSEVFQVLREELARYIRFKHDLVHGYTLLFTIVEGVRSYAFTCTKVQAMKLLNWMPHKSAADVERDIRRSGIAIALLGMLDLVVAQRMGMGMGLVLMALGALGYFRPQRALHAVNGVTLLATGLWDLFMGSFVASDGSSAVLVSCVIALATGIAFIVCGIQQFYMLSPNEHARVAREMRDKRVLLRMQRSHVVRLIAEFNIGAAALFGSYAIAVSLLARSGGGDPMAGLASAWAKPDLVVFGAASLLSLVSAVVLLVQARPAYAEAKVSAQVLLGVAVFAVWGMIFNLVGGSDFSFFGDVVYTDHVVYAPSVWGSLIASVLMFNRWFGRAVDRELELQR